MVDFSRQIFFCMPDDLLCHPMIFVISPCPTRKILALPIDRPLSDIPVNTSCGGRRSVKTYTCNAHNILNERKLHQCYFLEVITLFVKIRSRQSCGVGELSAVASRSCHNSVCLARHQVKAEAMSQGRQAPCSFLCHG